MSLNTNVKPNFIQVDSKKNHLIFLISKIKSTNLENIIDFIISSSEIEIDMDLLKTVDYSLITDEIKRDHVRNFVLNWKDSLDDFISKYGSNKEDLYRAVLGRGNVEANTSIKKYYDYIKKIVDDIQRKEEEEENRRLKKTKTFDNDINSNNPVDSELIKNYKTNWTKGADSFVNIYGSSSSSIYRFLKGGNSDSGRKALLKYYRDYNLLQDHVTTPILQTPTKIQQIKVDSVKSESYKGIKTLTINKQGRLIFNQSLKSKPTDEQEVTEISNFYLFQNSEFYNRVLKIMYNDNKNLKFSDIPITKHAVYCALVNLNSKIYAYVGETNGRPVRSRWIEHAGLIKKGETKKYKSMREAGVDNILVFYLTDKRTEHDCALEVFGTDKYVNLELSLNSVKCNNTYPGYNN